jgi:hypothetical protein
VPNPNDYDKKDKQKFMADCMHQVKTVENKPQDEAVSQCLGMWGNKDKKKCASEIIRKIAFKLLAI